MVKDDKEKVSSNYIEDSNHQIPITKKQIYIIVAWVLGMWLWGTFVNIVPGGARLIILAVTMIPTGYLFFHHPEYGIVALMFFVAGYLPPDFVDVRLPIGGFELRDILLFLLLGIVFFKRFRNRSVTIPWWPVGGILIIFIAIILSSVFNAMYFEGVTLNWTLGEARLLFFYAIFFVVAWSITTKKSLFMMLIGSYAISNISGAIILIQQYLGPNQLLLDVMKHSSWAISATAGGVRVVPPGIVHMYFMVLISIGLTIYTSGNPRLKGVLLLQTSFLVISLLFTFTRSAWVASIISIFIIIVLSFPIYKDYIVRVIVLGVASLMFLVGVLGLLQNVKDLENDTLMSFVNRFTSIFDSETTESLSLEWRAFELQETTKAIKKSPLIGVGLGNSYRNITPFQLEAEGRFANGTGVTLDQYDRYTRYAHSSYLNITVKMGIPAMVVLLVFFFAAIIKSIFLYNRLSDKIAKSLVLTNSAGIFGILQWSIYHAQLMDAASTSVIGFVIGIIASVSVIYLDNPPTDSIDTQEAI